MKQGCFAIARELVANLGWTDDRFADALEAVIGWPRGDVRVVAVHPCADGDTVVLLAAHELTNWFADGAELTPVFQTARRGEVRVPLFLRFESAR